MAKTVVGLFNTREEANSVVQDLVNAGFSRDAISVVSQNATTDSSIAVGDDTTSGAGVGAGLGAATGGLFGLLVGLGVLAIPGIGPVLAAGPLAAAVGSAAAAVGGAAVGAVGGAAVGGLLGALVDAGVPEEDAHLYAEGVRRGGTLVMAHGNDTLADTAHSIMARHNAIDIDDRGSEWRKSGWDRFDSTGSPVSRADDKLGQKWEESSKVGTAGGTLAGAATGAAAGSVAGPVGTVVGGVAGAVVGAGLGAGADAAAEGIEDETFDPDTPAERARARDRGTAMNDTTTPVNRAGNKLGQKWEESSKVGTAGGAVAGAATGAAAGAVAGPVGAVAGGVAGAVVGGGLGAGADAAAEGIEDETFDPDTPAERARANARGARIYSTPNTHGSDTNGFTTYDNDFRSHYQTHYANSGYTYDQYLPTYRYGYSLANDEAYTGKDWTYVEPEARRRWEERNPNSWERFKDSIQYAWDKARGAR